MTAQQKNLRAILMRVELMQTIDVQQCVCVFLQIGRTDPPWLTTQQNCRIYEDLGNEREFGTACASALPPKWLEVQRTVALREPIANSLPWCLAGKQVRAVHRTMPPQHWTCCFRRYSCYQLNGWFLYFYVLGLQKKP